VAPPKDWKLRLGALLLAERVQVKHWNYTEAATAAKIDPGTVKRIEDGQNYEVSKLDRYALALGRPTEAWLREAMAIPLDLLQRLSEWSSEEAARPPERKKKGG
jgi:transcriptional regulator with XRE-family HTH domain